MLNSHEWLDAICGRLFAAETRRINTMMEDLNRRNSEIKKRVLFGFMHMGERFIPESCRIQAQALRKQPMPPLAFELLNDANAFMQDVKRIQTDRDQIRQVLFKLLYQANNLQEIRDSLPECLVPLVPEVAKMPRFIQDPTWLIRNDPRAMKQYDKMLPKIEMYAMTRMLY